ncbi:MAG: Phosphoglycolate phosphatase [bacterium]|nr:Phosphoglycolate phosphatase [bacterium]
MAELFFNVNSLHDKPTLRRITRIVMTHSKYAVNLLLFDLDGTLVDTRRDLANAVNYALRQLGKSELDLPTLTSYVGDGVRKLLERALGNPSEAELESGRQHFRHFYLEHLADFSQPYPGILDMLEYFAGKKKAVLTNKPQEFTEPLLRQLGLASYFEMMIGGQPQLKLKPDPDAIFKILKQLEVLPAQAAMVGDSENDILAGKAAGLVTCAVTYGFRPPENLLSLYPDFVAHTPGALEKIFI